MILRLPVLPATLAAAGLALSGGLALSPAVAGAATITLTRTPALPVCAIAGTDLVQARWTITHETTPDEVVFLVENRARTETLHTETFPGATGIDAVATWAPPAGTDEDVWIRVVYHSLEQGEEASTELPAYVCTETAGICVEKREDADCDGSLGEGDPVVPGYGFLCVRTPYGDTVCAVSDGNGEACWSGIPTGSVAAGEFVAEGWTATGATEEIVVLGAGEDARIVFLNQRVAVCGSPVEMWSWGRLKSEYR